MIEITIPGFKKLQLKFLVLDFNGTIAFDGRLIPEVKPLLQELSKQLEIHVLTADTFGQAEKELEGIPCRTIVLDITNQAVAKLKYIEQLSPGATICIGNGRNDRLMVQNAVLGMVVLGKEGAATETILAADMIIPDISTALQLLLHPLRLTATLRS